MPENAGSTRPREPVTLPGSVLEDDVSGAEVDPADVEEDSDDFAAIDKLLEATDHGWGLDEQVLSLQQVAAGSEQQLRAPGTEVAPKSTPPPVPRKPSQPPPAPTAGRSQEPSPVRAPASMVDPGTLVDLLHARLAAVENLGDAVGLARVHMELAVASEFILGDDVRATTHAEAALRASPACSAAHGMLRRKLHGTTALPAMIAHLEKELEAATNEATRVELLAEKARLLDAAAAATGAARATWELALTYAPHHAAALKGLEGELCRRALTNDTLQDWEALAFHLGRLADAYGADRPLAAWLHVERAHVLETKLGKVDAARGALERALELDAGVGPVRAALVRHAATHADWTALATLLEDEARLEASAARAARLELDAAAIAASRLGDRVRACELLERAASRAPTAPEVDRRVLDDLVRMHETDGRRAEAAHARRARLRFVTDPAHLAYELRALASAAEQAGDLDGAIADVQRALALDGTDPTLVEMIDRLLGEAGKHDQRIATWLQEAARKADPVARGKAFLRAARICDTIGRPADATRHLRSAWVSSPGDAEVLDALARHLSWNRAEATDEDGARSLVELYEQASERATDEARKIAFLEKVALLWEDVLGDAGRAARAYERILEVDPNRRGAIVGLQRTSARGDDLRTLARALLEEARLSSDDWTRVDLRCRAAEALEHLDAARAVALVRDVLAENPSNGAALVLETRLEERAGRWEKAARSLRARIDVVEATAEKVALWLALAQMQSARLHKPLDALTSLEHARALDPTHPVPPEEIARVLEDHGDSRALRDAVERLAATAQTPEERARHLVRAAEIDELRLSDDAAAIRTYRRLLADAPGDDFLAERLGRVAARAVGPGPGGSLGELATLFTRRIEHAEAPERGRTAALDLAMTLLEREPERAEELLEAASAVSRGQAEAPALRIRETLARRSKDPAALARVLDAQGRELRDPRARLGALWGLCALEEWKLGLGGALGTYERVLELDPTDPGALEATVRIEMLSARRGDPGSRNTLAAALRALVPFAVDEEARLVLQLRLGLLLEAAAHEAADRAQSLLHEALERYGDALQIDALSVTAATGLARLGERLHDEEAILAAARALAELATDPRVKARYFVKAAELLADDDEADPESAPARRAEAAGILERALVADPDSIAAATKLGALLLDEGQEDRLVSDFRQALARAKSPDSVVMLGAEVARVARDQLKDLPLAIDAMRHVRALAPQHVPSLLTLAELYIAQRVWPDAVDALESVVSIAREATPKLTALFALASVYEKVLKRPADVERVLRAALAVDPYNARAISGLLRRLTSDGAANDDQTQRARRLEVASLLHRLAVVEKDPEQKSELFLELADVHVRLSDRAGAERALVEAVATTPSNARAFARLAAFFRRPEGQDAVGYARALTAVVGVGQQLGRVDARWLAALGHLEVESLSRLRDGIAHLGRAAQMDASLFETRFELAAAYARMGAHDEASRTLVAMLAPSPRPLLSVSDPASALAMLEKSFAADRRAEEAVVVSELRAIAGEIDEGRRAWLQARVVRPAGADEVLDRPTLVTHVLPAEGRHILLEVAAAIAGIEAKMLRADLGELGVGARDRLTARSGHPLRLLLDRVTKELGVGEVEIVVSPSVARPRVVAQDVPWVVVPPALAQKPETVQLATLARATARIAYGVPWLDELPPAHIEALLVAAARQVVPGYAADRMDETTAKLAAQQEPAVARALARRQRKLLEELAPHIASPQSWPLPVDTFLGALARAELRTAFLVTGQLLAVVEDVRGVDAVVNRLVETPSANALAAVLEHPLLGDVVRFALTSEATALRKGLGSTWTA